MSSTTEFFDFFMGSSSTIEDHSIDSMCISEPEDSPKMKLYKEGLYDPGSGEICTAYVTMSRSSVIRHPYYAYPSIKDPGILRALLYTGEDKFYEEDGQELYMDLCKEMKIVPVRCFYRDLKGKVANVRYYGVDPKGVRAMCLALAFNKTVKRFDLTSNFLEHGDACYHLGQLLADRNVLEELVLAGCRIGHRGMKKLVIYLYLRTTKLLDLSGNNIQDLGFTYLAEQIQKGAVIKQLNLSRNDLTSDSAMLLAEVMTFNDTIKYLDLSWNKFYHRRGLTALLRRLGHSKVLVELNLSWSSLAVSTALRNLLSIPTLRVLDLSNNKLPSLAARTIARGLHSAKKLQILDLSCNPFSPADALLLLHAMRNKKIKLRELRMDHIVVSKEFADELKEVMALEFRKKTKITYGEVLRNYSLPLYDLRILTFRRFVRTVQKKRRNKLDILGYFLELHKTQTTLEPNALVRYLKIFNAPINDEHIDALTKLFPGPRTEKGGRTISLFSLVDFIRRLWPDKKAPPTPPPPTPEPPKKQEKGKKAKKGKKKGK